MGMITIRRKGYYRADGTYVKPSTFKISDKGTRGVRSRGAEQGKYSAARGYSPWIKHEGKLGGAGYTRKSAQTRRRILAKAVRGYGYRSTLGSIQVLLRSTTISERERGVLMADKAWLMDNYSPRRAHPKKKRSKKKAKKRTHKRKAGHRKKAKKHARKTKRIDGRKALRAWQRSAGKE